MTADELLRKFDFSGNFNMRTDRGRLGLLPFGRSVTPVK